MAGAGITGAAAPRVTAIVLNWCNEADTAACLNSLASSHYEALTVLLVDNGSPDGSGERLHRRFPVTPFLQTGSNLGYAEGNNRGIKWALGNGADFVLVLNNDTVIDPDCIGVLVRASTETGASVAAPQILYFNEPDRVWYGGGVFSTMRAMGLHLRENEPLDASHQRIPITFACGCCFIIRSDVLRTLGGFDPSYFAYVEDAELSLRLARAGQAMIYDPAARVLHRINRGAQSTPFQIRQRDRNRRRLVARHYGTADRLRFAAWFYPTRVVHFARYVVRRQWKHAQAIVTGALSRV